ncbi:MAG: HAD-IIB family hydrolase [Candidatus Pacebacteria bacterium]|nr:HAD-IIB family hydrolase [Candidatus Paceibacterota bacterium]
MSNLTDKDLIIFDLDGTLAESKQPVDEDMAILLLKLLAKKKVAVISGGSFPQFQKQFLPALQKNSPSLFPNLYILPTSGSAMYVFRENNWFKEYSHDMTAAEKEKVYAAFKEAVEKSGEKMPEVTYGTVAEDRGSQITFSAAGQSAPVTVKAEWDPSEKKRLHIVSFLSPLLPEFTIGIGGMTSIDVTKKGFDKAFGVRKICEYTKIPIEKALYVGDALFEGGNDYEARASGVECFEVANVSATKDLIRKIIS